uniref:Uncharacterized protein n=1 Tax=Panagrolaimus superbus TaxID=310955 RepID=A0A914Z3Z4_9BILA
MIRFQIPKTDFLKTETNRLLAGAASAADKEVIKNLEFEAQKLRTANTELNDRYTKEASDCDHMRTLLELEEDKVENLKRKSK